MNRRVNHTIYIIACVLAMSCTKGSEEPARSRSIEIKAPAVADESYFVTAVREDGSFLFQASSFSRNGDGRYTGSHYWPLEGTLSFYADNCSGSRRAGSHGSGCMEIRMQSGVDTVAAKAEDVSNGSGVSLTFAHPLARLYAISLSSADGSAISVNSLRVVGRRSGWYCLRHSAWTEKSAPESTDFPASLHSCGDILLIPGTVTIFLNYTATVGSHTVTYEKAASVTLEAGKKTTVYASVGADSLEITTSTTVETWTENDVSVTM